MRVVKTRLARKRYSSAIIHLMAMPLELAMKKIKWLKAGHKTAFTVCLGLLFILLGAFVSSMHQNYVPHFLWDAAGYGVHGLGLAPIAKIIFDIIEIEV